MATFRNVSIIQPEDPSDIVYPEPNTTGEGEYPLISGAGMLAAKLAFGLKELRRSKGVAIKDVAERSGLDVATLSRLENGRIYNPRLDTLCRYAVALDHEIDANLVPMDPAYLDDSPIDDESDEICEVPPVAATSVDLKANALARPRPPA